MKYPITIDKEQHDYVLRFPDIPEAVIYSDGCENAVNQALDTLIDVLECYIAESRIIPLPTHSGMDWVVLPFSVWAKVLVFNAMVTQQRSRTELAQRMGTRKQEMQRILKLTHTTKIDTLALAMQTMGMEFSLKARQAKVMPDGY